MTEANVVTLSRHIVEEERKHPDATGKFSNILYDIALAAKIISREVNKAGLVDILGRTGKTNVHGEAVQKLDIYAHDVIYKAMDHTGNLCCMASEEYPEVLPIPDRFPVGEYVLLFDPLDGSSNIDVNVSIGTIFSIHRKASGGVRGGLEDCLQPGSRQVAAGYVVYGSSTMLVYSSGAGVHGFTLDPGIGEFLLSHPDIRMPEPPDRTYSVNEAYYGRWSEGQRRLVDYLKGTGGGGGGFSSRYVGSLVADFHRTLLRGGIFMYPADRGAASGKLRLLYEAAPLAYIVEQAGGRATDGRRDVLQIQPRALHERTPLYIGSRELVDLAHSFLSASRNSEEDQISASDAGVAAAT
jgi:fructose-1,6-bisphosphatase I